MKAKIFGVGDNLVKKTVVVLIFPIFLLIIMLLPIKEALVLQIHDPAIWQLLTYASVHHGWGHYLGNVIVYVVLVGFLG